MVPRINKMLWALGIAVLLTWVTLIDGKPTSYQENLIDSNLNQTIEEVVGLLGKRPDLPRLTRGEIIELVADVRRQKSLTTEQKSQEPLVVVMPFKPNGTSIEELYTKAPVTQVVGDLAVKLTSKRPGQKRRRKPVPRPVYVHTEATSEFPSTTALTTPLEPASNIKKIPLRTTSTTTKPTTTTTVKSWKPLDELVIPEGMKEVIEDISVKPETVKPYFVTPELIKPTTKSPIPPEQVSVAAESLSDEMKDLLATFGLLGPNKEEAKPTIKEPQQQQHKDPYYGFEFGAIKPKVDPNSYVSFKPLPDSGDESMTSEMRDFLASFGLINDRNGRDIKSEPKSKMKRSKNRDERTLKEVPKVNSEMFSDDMMSVLENLGITQNDGDRKAKKLGQHIFNPALHAADLIKTDQISKVQQLVSKIREISENREIQSLTPNELKELLSAEADLIRLGEDGNLLIKTDSLENNEGPDPLSLDEIVELLDKNENKRQESTDSNEGSSQTSPSMSTRRYDNDDDIKYNEETGADKVSEEDSTPVQSMTSMVTSLPDELSTNGKLESGATTPASETSISDSSSAAATGSSSAASSPSSSSEGSSSSSAASSSASSDGSVSSSSSSTDDRASSSATSETDSSSASASATASGSSSSSPDSDNQAMANEGPSFDDLNESFGGEITTTPRPNGLYFLLDWNSFLQVGTDERKVDLSFNPKIGDSRNFYPIKFP